VEKPRKKPQLIFIWTFNT